MVTEGGVHLGLIAAWQTSSLAKALSPSFPSIESFIEPLSSSTRAKSIGVTQIGDLGGDGGCAGGVGAGGGLGGIGEQASTANLPPHPWLNHVAWDPSISSPTLCEGRHRSVVGKRRRLRLCVLGCEVEVAGAHHL